MAKTTEPVDTDALTASAIEDSGLSGMDTVAWLAASAGVARGYRAATDEVDRLRAELGTQERVNIDLSRAADAFLGERDRLRAVIEDAPHAEDCYWSRRLVPIPEDCACWKAGAL